MGLGLRCFGGLIAVWITASVGCGDDGSVTGPPDGGRRDGAPLDTGVPDGAGPDGAVTDGGGADVGGPSCAFVPATDVFELGTDSAGLERRIAAAPGPDGVLLVWAQNQDGTPDILSRFIPSGGPAPDPVDVTDDFYTSRNPGVARVEDAYLAAWIDNSEGDFEVMAQPLDASGASTGSATPVTDNTVREGDLALAGFGAGAVLAWVEVVPGDGGVPERTLWTALLDATGSVSGTVHEVRTGASITRPVVAADGDTAVLAWVEAVDSEEGGDRVAVQALGSTGAPSGSVGFADTQMNASGTVDVAYATGGMETTGGAAVYGVNVSTRGDVRWRHLDAAGAVDGSEVPFTSGMDEALDPSVAPFRGGFVTSLRLLPASGEPLVQLVFVDNAGDQVGRMDLVQTTEQGGRTTVGVGLDGHLVVGWSEPDLTATQLRAARLRCAS